MTNTVLLVDDEPVFNFIADTHIKRVDPSANVFSVFNGKEALTILQEAFKGERKVPTHIFVDLNMPVMDGFSFLEAFKKLPELYIHDIKVFVVTTSLNPLDKERVKSYNFPNYVNKPLSTEFLKSILI